MNFKNIFKSTQVTHKALPISTTSELFVQAPAIISRDPINLLNNYKGVVYSCQSKNSAAVSLAQFKLYATVNKGKSLNKFIPHNNLKNKDLNFLKSIKAISFNEDVVEITEHPFLDLIYNVSDRYDKQSLFEMTENYIGLLGNCYWYVEKDSDGLPISIDILPTEYVSIKLDAENKISQYVLNYQGVIKTYERSDIIHFKTSVAGTFRKYDGALLTNLYGMGALEAVRDEVALLNQINQYELNLMSNNARPDFVVNYKGKLQENDKKELFRSWNRIFAGTKNAGKVQISDGDFEIKELGFNPKDLAYNEGKKYLKNTICNAFGVPIDLLDTENSNRASALTALQQYYQFTISPKLRKIEETITQNLLSLYDDSLFMAYDNIIPMDEKVIAETNAVLVDAGILTVDEVRATMGLEPIVKA